DALKATVMVCGPMAAGSVDVQPAATAAWTRRFRLPSLEGVIIAAFGVFGLRQGAVQIHDNGVFTHLNTGITMAQTGAIPRRDPYSFTAHGHLWVVQSWLPEWTYGWVYRVGGYRLFIFEQ